MREGLAKGKLSILLRGEKLKGSFALVRTKEAKQWLLIKHKDRFAAPTTSPRRTARCSPAMAVEDLKVVPAQRMPAVAARRRRARSSRCPRSSRRCSPKSGDAPFNRADWMWEPKLDGYRVLAFIDERRRQAALAARARARRARFRGSPTELAQAGRRTA